MENQEMIPEWIRIADESGEFFDYDSLEELPYPYSERGKLDLAQLAHYEREREEAEHNLAFEMGFDDDSDIIEDQEKCFWPEINPRDYVDFFDRQLSEDDFFGENLDLLTGQGNNRHRAFDWIVRESHVDIRNDPKKDEKINITLDELIRILEVIQARSMYQVIKKKKKSGDFRLIYAPDEELKKVQKAINRLLRKKIPKPENAFGFSGGGIYDALRPHLGATVIMTVDCKDAFPTVSQKNVFHQLSRKRFTIPCMQKGKPAVRRVGYFSWYVSNIISQFATLEGKMVQGPPTSPRLFDLCCETMDEEIAELAKGYGATYTRYADNLFVSVNSQFFPDQLKSCILQAIQGLGLKDAVKFEYHKLKVKRTEKGAVRSLGINIIDGQIHNTRAYKRNIRLTIHRLFWLIYNGRPEKIYEPVWNKLKGMISFANQETLPKCLVEQYKILEESLY